jgi:hypothetical protein
MQVIGRTVSALPSSRKRPSAFSAVFSDEKTSPWFKLVDGEVSRIGGQLA